MIYTTMDNLKSYYGISENLDKALDFLETCDLRTLAMGRNEVEGSQVFINRFNYDTIAEEAGAFEAHEKHLDIHIFCQGMLLKRGIGLKPSGKVFEK